MKEVLTILRDRHMLITILHHSTDPANWILRQWKGAWWRKKRIVSLWFTDRQQAIRHAEGLKRDYEAGLAGPSSGA